MRRDNSRVGRRWSGVLAALLLCGAAVAPGCASTPAVQATAGAPRGSAPTGGIGGTGLAQNGIGGTAVDQNGIGGTAVDQDGVGGTGFRQNGIGGTGIVGIVTGSPIPPVRSLFSTLI